ncbi:MAG: MEDS domain-containing protein, partial [Candidatus Rokubacteria bacterium]|nr:MEDS domain-containing protein [Candidatus Rokubacteria bacterium]
MSELEQGLAPVEPGHHICLVYDNPAEQLAAVLPFLKEGLARGAQCVYVADDRTVEEVATALTAAGVDVARERERGALLLSTRED